MGAKVQGDPFLLTVESSKEGYSLAYDGGELYGASGQVVSHSRRSVLDAIVAGYCDLGDFPVNLCSRRIVTSDRLTFVDFVCVDALAVGSARASIRSDPLVCGLDTKIIEDDRLGPVIAWVGGGAENVRVRLEDNFDRLSPSQQGVCCRLAERHSVGLGLPIGFVRGFLDFRQYAAAASIVFMRGHSESVVEQNEYFEKLRSDAWVASRFLLETSLDVSELISDGESGHLEFKSTFKRNLYTGKNDSEISHASLKSVAAFLNKDGGKLVIGVKDDGTPLGDLCGAEGVPSSDVLMLHIVSKMRDAIGGTASALVDVSMRELLGEPVCLLECPKSLEPVYLESSNGSVGFFVRVGPSSVELNVRDAVAFIASHFDLDDK